MNPVLLQFGSLLAALALLLYAVVSFLTGTAFASGAAVREAIKGPLRRFRDGSSIDRADLADRTILLGIALCGISVVAESSIVSVFIAVVMWRSRPQVKMLTSSEHPLLSLGSQVSGDMVVGLCAPIALAHLLIGNVWLFLATASVVVALCWPTGGPGRRVGGWVPLPARL